MSFKSECFSNILLAERTYILERRDGHPVPKVSWPLPWEWPRYITCIFINISFSTCPTLHLLDLFLLSACGWHYYCRCQMFGGAETWRPASHLLRLSKERGEGRRWEWRWEGKARKDPRGCWVPSAQSDNPAHSSWAFFNLSCLKWPP